MEKRLKREIDQYKVVIVWVVGGEDLNKSSEDDEDCGARMDRTHR